MGSLKPVYPSIYLWKLQSYAAHQVWAIRRQKVNPPQTSEWEETTMGLRRRALISIKLHIWTINNEIHSKGKLRRWPARLKCFTPTSPPPQCTQNKLRWGHDDTSSKNTHRSMCVFDLALAGAKMAIPDTSHPKILCPDLIKPASSPKWVQSSMCPPGRFTS